MTFHAGVHGVIKLVVESLFFVIL